MSTAATAGMQAALLIREKQRLRRKHFRKGRPDLPSHIATKEIGPFPQYPPGFLCSQGRAAWQERERGRRCSLSEEARQHRIKQTEAHHRWMKRNRIHDTSFGAGSDEEDFFDVYHQSAAANALLYVGLGTVALGSIIFFVGTGEKGFKTLELRLIGPTLVACGLLCCLIRVLLCACPASTCFRKRRKNRLKNACPHSCSRYPLAPKYNPPEATDFVSVDNMQLLHKQKKKVSIVPPNYSIPSTSTSEFKELPQTSLIHEEQSRKISIPQINLPDLEESRLSREDSIIELQNFDQTYDIESISSNDSDTTPVLEPDKTSKLSKKREAENAETSLSVVIERNDASESSDVVFVEKHAKPVKSSEKQTHSGIVLSPLQLGQ